MFAICFLNIVINCYMLKLVLFLCRNFYMHSVLSSFANKEPSSRSRNHNLPLFFLSDDIQTEISYVFRTDQLAEVLMKQFCSSYTVKIRFQFRKTSKILGNINYGLMFMGLCTYLLSYLIRIL